MFFYSEEQTAQEQLEVPLEAVTTDDGLFMISEDELDIIFD